MSSVLRLDEPQLPCICTSFSRFERLFICFTQFGGSFHCLNFVKFREDYRAFHKLLGNFVATSRISSNFMYSEQFLQLSSNSEISEQFLFLNWPFCHTSQCFSRQIMNFL